MCVIMITTAYIVTTSVFTQYRGINGDSLTWSSDHNRSRKHLIMIRVE